MAKPAFICETCRRDFATLEIAEWHEEFECPPALLKRQRDEKARIGAELEKLFKENQKLQWERFLAGAECRDREGEGFNTPEARRKPERERKRRGLAPAPAELTAELAPRRRQKCAMA